MVPAPCCRMGNTISSLGGESFRFQGKWGFAIVHGLHASGVAACGPRSEWRRAHIKAIEQLCEVRMQL